ncbi:MAG TPA: phosphocholine cytidylyltransferase family protein [Acidiferrobacteraceae bacterium]|nr:phosphocholine cytidylyltransferase family protein [Acidiferrobacteraceae bacterium]
MSKTKIVIGRPRVPDHHGRCARASTTNVTTALLLAAGAGTRLQPLTLDAPKCLTEIGGVPILERLVNNLRVRGFKRLIVVIGHLGDRIQEFLQQHAGDMRVDYVINPDYRTTNNIYSLWLAREQIREPFLLVESDLVFDSWMLDDILQPGKMAISNIRPWMNGTTVRLEAAPGLERRVAAFSMGGDICSDARQYKTVNLYSLSFNSWSKIEERLSRYVSEGRLGEYYEFVFAEMVADGTLSFDAVFFDADRWYEIDTRADLREAENLFSRPRSVASRSPSLSLDITEPVATVA